MIFLLTFHPEAILQASLVHQSGFEWDCLHTIGAIFGMNWCLFPYPQKSHNSCTVSILVSECSDMRHFHWSWSQSKTSRCLNWKESTKIKHSCVSLKPCMCFPFPSLNLVFSISTHISENGGPRIQHRQVDQMVTSSTNPTVHGVKGLPNLVLRF